MAAISQGVDYSFARPSPAGLYAAGKRFAGRYIGPGSGKLLEAPERDALFAAGLSIFLLAEGNADSAAGGYQVGVSHGFSALRAAQALGVPDLTAIYFAVDYDVSAPGWPAARDYLYGAGSVIGRARVGVYGGIDVMEWSARDGAAAWFFQTYAWSEGRWYGDNHVEQYHNGVIVAGGEVDLCRNMQANFGQWNAPGQPPEENDMPAYTFLDEHGRKWRTNSDWTTCQLVVPPPAGDPGAREFWMNEAGAAADVPIMEGGAMKSFFMGAGPDSYAGIFGVNITNVGQGSGSGGSGGGATPDQVKAIVRAELNKTVLPAVPGKLEG